ncbi:hypothetical protein ACVILK_004803 [Bradyrhizobium embrapense]
MNATGRQNLRVVKPVAISRIENWNAFASRESSELAITRIEVTVNEGLGQMSIFPVGSLGQIDSFYPNGRAMKNGLIESITHAWLAARRQVSAILLLNLPFQIDQNSSVL